MRTKEDITKILRDNKTELIARYPIKELALFGSFSRGDQKEDSDIDILVEFSAPIGLQFVDLAEELEYLLANKVDLVSRNGIKEKYFEVIEPDLIYV